MAKITPITEQFQHFLAEMKESFWGDLYGRTRQAWKQYFELESERLRDRIGGLSARSEPRARSLAYLEGRRKNSAQTSAVQHARTAPPAGPPAMARKAPR